LIFTSHKRIAITKLVGGAVQGCVGDNRRGRRNDRCNGSNRGIDAVRGLADPHSINKTFNRQIAAVILDQLDRIRNTADTGTCAHGDASYDTSPAESRQHRREDEEMTDLFARVLGRGICVTKKRVGCCSH
jgi:hypothetical protein